jgi:hypothetical protein
LLVAKEGCSGVRPHSGYVECSVGGHFARCGRVLGTDAHFHTELASTTMVTVTAASPGILEQQGMSTWLPTLVSRPTTKPQNKARLRKGRKGKREVTAEHLVATGLDGVGRERRVYSVGTEFRRPSLAYSCILISLCRGFGTGFAS